MSCAKRSRVTTPSPGASLTARRGGRRPIFRRCAEPAPSAPGAASDLQPPRCRGDRHNRGPITPAERVFVAIGVAVSALRTTELVARKQHWRTLREQESREQIAALTAADSPDSGIVGRSLGAIIGAEISVVPVVVLLPV